MTILGTRPEIIRLSLILKKLDTVCSHVLVHTGQNFETSLFELFFQELGLRTPDHVLNSRKETAMGQVGAILENCEQIIKKEFPDRILILGDTNSGLSAIVAKRMGIPVFHMEAGNRCFDDRVPEEVNRRVIDHSSDILMPYTEHSRRNLLNEGIAINRILVTGNPIGEVLEYYKPKIRSSRILNRLELIPRQYFTATLHRAENVDHPDRLNAFIRAFNLICEKTEKPLVCLVHPRTRSKLSDQMIAGQNPLLKFIEPLGFFDFVHLEKQAACMLTDSGTVQEECCLFKTPNVTLRDTTERPETIEAGSNILSGADPDTILSSLDLVLKQDNDWTAPDDYLVKNVSETVIKILTGFIPF